MSRVHDALRRMGPAGAPQPPVPHTPMPPPEMPPAAEAGRTGDLLDLVQDVPFQPAPEALLIDSARPQEPPSEEFRSLRTRLNHLQTLNPIHCIVVTSPSPAEGKSFAAANLALAESHLADNRTLLVDFDFRRPAIHTLFQLERSPGATDYLTGEAPLHAAIRHIAGTNLYVLPAGRPVRNPLELLSLPEVKSLFRELPKTFNWVILDSPPLLFSADANLLGTLTDGTILVVRVGQTTIDTVQRSMQTLCENNVLGIVVNGARAGELYSKYTYYYAKHGRGDSEAADGAAPPPETDAPPE